LGKQGSGSTAWKLAAVKLVNFSLPTLAVLLIIYLLENCLWYFHKPLVLAKTTEKYSAVFCWVPFWWFKHVLPGGDCTWGKGLELLMIIS